MEFPRSTIVRIVTLFAGYLAVTFLAVILEVLWSLVNLAKWAFIGATVLYAASVFLVCFGLYANIWCRGHPMLALGLSVLAVGCGILLAVVIGTNLKFMIGGTI